MTSEKIRIKQRHFVDRQLINMFVHPCGVRLTIIIIRRRIILFIVVGDDVRHLVDMSKEGKKNNEEKKRKEYENRLCNLQGSII